MELQLQEIQSIYLSQKRLVEGLDYVRAEWLKGDIPISTSMMELPINSKNFEFKRNFIQLMNSGYFVALSSNTYYSYFITDYGDMRDLKPMIWNRTTNEIVYTFSSRIGLGIHTITCNDSGVTISSTTNTASLPLYGNPQYISFNNAFNGNNKNTIHLTSSIKVDGVVRYVPCQLLRSIPSTLDANGIARSAGECGMIDSISGKFYGNVASSGAFTVENLDESGTVEDTRLHQIYKNKLVEGTDYMIGEMLKGTGGCYIDTMINPTWNDQLSATTKVSRRPTVKSPTLLDAFDANTRIGIVLGGAWYQSASTQILAIQKVSNTNDYVVYKGFPASAEIYMSLKVTNNAVPITSCKINGASWTNVDKKGTNIITELPNVTYKIGRDTQNGLDVLRLKNVEINSHNFIPCKLLRPIPRNLDAQCKSRQTGECGMIDLVSGRFYGNVASSGVFSLAWDEWLKDCSIQIDMEQTLGITNYAPPTIIYKGRIDTTKLTSELTDFGYVKISNTQIVCNQQTWSFSNWGTYKWATIAVSYGGVGGCNVKVNGTDVGSQTEQVTGIFNPHIFLYDIVQLNKIDYTFYPNQSDPTYSVNLIFSRGVDESIEKQYMTDNDGATYRIYAD